LNQSSTREKYAFKQTRES